MSARAATPEEVGAICTGPDCLYDLRKRLTGMTTIAEVRAAMHLARATAEAGLSSWHQLPISELMRALGLQPGAALPAIHALPTQHLPQPHITQDLPA
jgi:hypothetical protein